MLHDRGVLQCNEYRCNKRPNTPELEANLKEAIESIQARIARAEEKMRQNDELIQNFNASAIISAMKGLSTHSSDPRAKAF